jgi:hypothetical protein
MFSVIFEVLPRKENWDDYLENAKMLRPELEQLFDFLLEDSVKHGLVLGFSFVLTFGHFNLVE